MADTLILFTKKKSSKFEVVWSNQYEPGSPPNKQHANMVYNYHFNKESRNGIYIIHGFTSDTNEVRDLAEYLGRQGF